MLKQTVQLKDFTVKWSRWEYDPLTQRPTGSLAYFTEVYYGLDAEAVEETWRVEYEDFQDAELLEVYPVKPTERQRAVPNDVRKYAK